MSNKRRDYTRYSNPVKAETTPAVIEEPVTVTPEEQTEIETVDVPNVAVYGIVENCKALNVRESGDIEAPIISVIAAGNVVEVFEDESTEDFYKVHVENDTVQFDGFCMKKFIRLV